MSDYPDIIQGAKPGHLIHRPTLLPVATYVILGLNFLVFVLMVAMDASTLPKLNDLLARIATGMSTNPEFLLRLGASFGPYTRRGEYWRLVMPMFLHIGLLHLVINNYSLYVLGRLLEPIYGYGRFAFLYVVAGVGSAIISMSMSDKVSAGASGAIFGLAGIMLVAGYLHRGSIPRQWGRAFGRGMLPIIVLNLALGGALHQWVDNWAHLGGLVTGCILALLIPPPKRDFIPGQPMEEHSQALVVIPIVVVAIAAGFTVQNYRAYSAVTNLLLQGDRFLAVKRDDWALERFRQAALRLPRDERPHLAMGSLYLKDKKWTDAISEFNQALQLGSMPLAPQIGLAKAYQGMGNTAKAREALQAVEKDFSDTAPEQAELGGIYSESKLDSEAASHYERAVRLKPDFAEAQNNLARLYATSDDPKVRNPQAALVHAKVAVQLTQWKQAYVIDTLAEALYVNQQFDEAVKAETKALALEPRNQEYAEHMARYQKAAASLPEKKRSV
jgi:membrane associated rhomboid family serine protease/cytochrome c-type biogenesis protein CcmH/NrfG